MNTIVTPPAEALADCDLLMKGGITSGVVYPRLLAKLAVGPCGWRGGHGRLRMLGCGVAA